MILYQIVMAFALVVTLAHQGLRGARGAVAERLGFGPRPAKGPRLWLHAASVGEVTSARWVKGEKIRTAATTPMTSGRPKRRMRMTRSWLDPLVAHNWRIVRS